jgi:hypothetical protein
MKIKQFILLSLVVAISLKSSAQVRTEPFYPYAPWTVGGGIGFSEIYGNLNHSNSEPVINLHFARNINMWINIDLDVKRGALSDYEVKNSWTNGLSVYNTINTGALKAHVCLGEFFRYPRSFFMKNLFGLYFGTGVGYMTNDVSNITLKFRHQDKYKITRFQFQEY